MNSYLSTAYSPKQIEVLKFALNHNWQLIINHGAVRSGKTVADNDIFLHELRAAAEKARQDKQSPLYILSAETIGNIEKNVLSELRTKYGLKIKLDKFNTFPLLGCRVCCFGHGKSDSYQAIVGMTAYGAYMNEMSTATQSAYDEIQKRCSGRLRVIGDTNPEHPEHWLKKDYIDNADNKRIAAFHWKLTDNPFLSDEYVEGIKAITPKGMFYERKINGLWVMADGMVLQNFDSTKHFVTDLDGFKFTHYVGGVDWGYEHYGVIQVYGVTADGVYVLVDEIGKQYQEIDYWVDVAKTLNAKYNYAIPYFCDSARPEHVARFLRENIRAYNADKSILSGIEEIEKMYKLDKLYIYKPNAELFAKQVYTYVWDGKSGLPIKQNDDSIDTQRYAIYTSRIKPNIR